MGSGTLVEEKLPASIETAFLRDLHAIVGRVSELLEGDRMGKPRSDRTLVALLELVLTMESTFAVWYWGHAHLENINPGTGGQISFRSRAQAAVEDADRIVERLHQIKQTTMFQVEWLPSAGDPISAATWILNGDVRDRIALAADGIALNTYARLIEYARKNNLPICTLFEEIAAARKKRLSVESTLS